MTFRAFAGRTFAARTLAAGAAMTLLAGSAWAACEDDIQALDEQMVTAETGSTPSGSDLPATEHQQEVLSGDNQAVEQSDMPATKHQQEVLSGDSGEPLETGAGSSGDVEATSPHQRQVVREVDDDSQTQASALLDEARQMAEAGDEAGCQAKVTEAEALLGAR